MYQNLGIFLMHKFLLFNSFTSLIDVVSLLFVCGWNKKKEEPE